MFARLLGQNIMSHAIWSDVDGCTVGIWWIERDNKYIVLSHAVSPPLWSRLK